jgi:hypothetical protein
VMAVLLLTLGWRRYFRFATPCPSGGVSVRTGSDGTPSDFASSLVGLAGVTKDADGEIPRALAILL